jgi:hypothetical protein
VVFFAGSCQWFVDVMELHGGWQNRQGVLYLFAILFALFAAAFVKRFRLAARMGPARYCTVLWADSGHLFTGVPWCWDTLFRRMV